MKTLGKRDRPVKVLAILLALAGMGWLANQFPMMRAWGLRAVGWCGKPALPVVRRALQDGDPEVRWAVSGGRYRRSPAK